jgi:glucosamine kinase
LGSTWSLQRRYHRPILKYDFRMRWVLGFDGGGTKTDCVLAAESGAVRARGTAGPSNPFRVGFGAAFGALREAAEKALAGTAIATPKRAEGPVQGETLGKEKAGAADVAAVCAGLAGVGQPADAEKMRALLAAEFPRAVVCVCTDLELVLAAAPAGPAMVLVAGTGSAAIGRSASGGVTRIGGHGPMISDEGSAYDVGRRAVIGAQREFDRSGKDSELGKRILREMGSPQWADLRKRIQAAPDEVFPRLFSVVAALADSGDQVSQGILRNAAYQLASIATTLAERLHLADEPFPLVKTGGMIGRSKYLDAQLHERLRVTMPQAAPSSLEIAPAEAAARLAAELLQTAKPAVRPK